MLDGGFEEAFRLCSCNYAPEGEGKRAREWSERAEIALESRLPLASKIVTPRMSVELDAAIFR
jgi:predicted secreted protein